MMNDSIALLSVGEGWAITESGLEALLVMTDQPVTTSAEFSPFSASANAEAHIDSREGVAVIPVIGPLFRYENFLTLIGRATSYEALAEQFNQALSSNEITSIVLDIDSPGGEVNGCAEMANLLFNARGKKPVIAYASGSATSGAYWLASACDEVIASETAMLGSIGVAAVYQSKANDKTIDIVSSQSPYKRLDPKSDEGKAKLQTRIDALAEVFIASIAKHRGVDPPTVLNNFGGGDVFVGQQAVNQGLADQVGSLDSILKHHAQPKNPAQSQGFSFLSLEEKDMTTEQTGGEAALTLASLKQDHPALVEAIATETLTRAEASLTQSAIQKERKRIGAIIASSAAEGRDQLAQHLAFSTDMSAEIALAALEVAPKTTQAATPTANTGFDQVMANMQNPQIEPEAQDEALDAEAIAKRIAGFSQGGAA